MKAAYSCTRAIAVWAAAACLLPVIALAAGATRMEDFRGLWQPIDKVTTLLATDGRSPVLKPAAAKLHEAARASAAKGDRWFDNELDCLPMGMTRLMAESAFELVVDEQLVALAFEWNRHVHVAPRRAKHLDEYDYPAYLGHTIAFMSGNALLLDSVYFNDDTVLDHSGLPHGERLHVQQSLTLRDANTLVNTMTITDPDTFAAPWKTQLSYRRLPQGTSLKEDVCVERLGLTRLNAHRRREEGLRKLGLAP